MNFGYLGASECPTAGSSEPAEYFRSLINTSMGQNVRHAITSRYVVRVPLGSSWNVDQAINQIVAVYLQWTWVAIWGSRDPSLEDIMKDASGCLSRAVAQVAPLSTDKPHAPTSQPPQPKADWTKTALIVGGVVVGGLLLYTLLKKKKGQDASGALALPSVEKLALPGPSETKLLPEKAS
jgi:hypothetical protein